MKRMITQWMAGALALAGLLGLGGIAMASGPEGELINENFQTPAQANNTAAAFDGWTMGNANVKVVNESTADFPGDANFSSANQGIKLEWNGGISVARYVLTHAWSVDDVFLLTLNASPQAWSIASARWIRPMIRQNSDTTVLWDPGETAETKLYQELADPNPWAWNGPGPYGNSTWQAEPELLYTFTINAGEFTTGTPGQTIYLELGSSGARGMFYDNVNFSLLPPPPPSATLILIK